MSLTSEQSKKETPKKIIVEGMLQLLTEKSYAQLTITEVSKKAGFSRRTFYRHFDTLDDVLDYQLQKMSEELALVFLKEASKEPSFQDYVVMYFTYWSHHQSFLNTLKENELLPKLLFSFMPSVSNKLPKPRVADSSNDYLQYFIFGGIFNLLVKWLEDGAEMTPSEMGEIAEEVVKRWRE